MMIFMIRNIIYLNYFFYINILCEFYYILGILFLNQSYVDVFDLLLIIDFRNECYGLYIQYNQGVNYFDYWVIIWNVGMMICCFIDKIDCFYGV